jgi:hypothetical protein
LRARGPCGKNRPPAGAVSADSRMSDLFVPGMLP